MPEGGGRITGLAGFIVMGLGLIGSGAWASLTVFISYVRCAHKTKNESLDLTAVPVLSRAIFVGEEQAS